LADSDCIFCKIAGGKIDAEVVHEEEEVVAFKDINGQAPTHVLVIPRRHVANLEAMVDLPDTAARRLLQVSSEVANKLGIGESGYAVRINNGPDAGQEIFHLHLHVLGGRKLGMP
jgi:histidine triad (HIT) family protein